MVWLKIGIMDELEYRRLHFISLNKIPEVEMRLGKD